MAFHANMASSFSLSSKTFLSDFRSNFPSLFFKQLFTRLDMHWSLWWWYQKVAPKSPKHQKKEVFHLKEKVGISQLEGLFLTVFEVLLAFCPSYTLWQNPIFCPKIQFYLFDIEFEFWRQNWNYLEGSIFWNKKLYFATVCISSGQWKASCFFSGNF